MCKLKKIYLLLESLVREFLVVTELYLLFLLKEQNYIYFIVKVTSIQVMDIASTASVAEGTLEEVEKPIGCAHYKRKSKFVVSI